MLQAHEKDVAAFQTEAEQGQDPDVKAFAAQTLPTLQQHLEEVRSIVNPGGTQIVPQLAAQLALQLAAQLAAQLQPAPPKSEFHN